MVRGLPLIERVGELCDSCLTGKQRHAPFPKTASYRARDLLELVHGDLCKPITPATHGLLSSKDEAATAIRHFKARVEGETGKKLKVLRTDRGGEFTSIKFAPQRRALDDTSQCRTHRSKMAWSNGKIRPSSGWPKAC